MGNYKHFEIDFVERTLELITQYEGIQHKYDFEKQFNYTLLVNCLLGLIVLPKERAISFLPNDRIVSELREEMGIVNSTFHPDIADLKSLIIALRHSIAHFDIHFISEDEKFLIDRIVFKDKAQGGDFVAASFVPSELLSFMRYYADWFTSIIREYRPDQLVD